MTGWRSAGSWCVTSCCPISWPVRARSFASFRTRSPPIPTSTLWINIARPSTLMTSHRWTGVQRARNSPLPWSWRARLASQGWIESSPDPSRTYSVQEHRFAVDVAHLRPVVLDIIQLIDVHAPNAFPCHRHGHISVNAVPQRDHPAEGTPDRQIGCHDSIVDGDHEVERVRVSRAHHIGDLLIDNVLSGDLAKQVPGNGADPAEFLVDESVLPASQDDITSHDLRPLGNGQHGVVARVGGFVADQEASEFLWIEWDFRDNRPVHAGQIGADKTSLTAVATEKFDDRQPLVRPGACPQAMNNPHATGDRRREADAVLCAVHVIVHRLWYRYDRDPLLVQSQRV